MRTRLGARYFIYILATFVTALQGSYYLLCRFIEVEYLAQAHTLVDNLGFEHSSLTSSCGLSPSATLTTCYLLPACFSAWNLAQ